LIRHHVSGQLKVAPEHVSDRVLKYMGKPSFKVYERFKNRFYELTKSEGKKQYLVPYLMSSHPGSTVDDAIQLASEKAGLPDYKLEFYPKKKDFMTELSDMFEISQKKLGLSIVFSKESAIFEQIRQIDRYQALMPIQFEIR
jgi:radical SAM superfamily enzyme YgiQ (UPF0313 family)